MERQNIKRLVLDAVPRRVWRHTKVHEVYTSVHCTLGEFSNKYHPTF
jgi:hypothetical protein